MSEMVVRVARAMMEASDLAAGGHVLLPESIRLEKFVPLAHAAITAMREPTDEMVASGYTGITDDYGSPREVFCAMIDKALE